MPAAVNAIARRSMSRQTRSRKGTRMDDLTGSSEERARQLTRLESEGPLPPEWVRRQLGFALEAWAADQKALDIDAEGREDY
jgi:hypothetical protein